jgi:DNA invertase Pin-like site-specific DNA recombinase
MKAIIYCRKSTDREDKQQLSLSAQVEEANKIALRE